MNRSFFRRWNGWVAISISWLLAVQCLAAQPARKEKNGSREAMLRDLAQKVIAAGYTRLATQCRSLADDIEKFNASPDQAALDRARQDWLAAFEAADSLRCFQTGPVTDRQFGPTFYYWQAIPNRIEGIVKNPSQTIDQALLDSAGATVQGLYAMEYLLFDRRGGQPTEPPDSARALDLLSATPRRREYLLTVARDVAEKARVLSGDWSATGPQSAAEKFAAGGQATVNLLVNQLTQSLENTMQNHLSFILTLPAPLDRQLFRVKGPRSGSSLQSVVVALEGLDKFYRGENGLGLRDSVNHLNPALATRVQEKLAATIAATRAIGEPLERAAADKPAAIQNAVDQAHELEVLFKVDLASALGVTITFTSGDGD